MFILLPFLPEDTLNELADKHGKELRHLYQILVQHPKSFEKLVSLLAIPVLIELIKEYPMSTAQVKMSPQQLLQAVGQLKKPEFDAFFLQILNLQSQHNQQNQRSKPERFLQAIT